VNADAILAAIASRQLIAAGENSADKAAGISCHDAPFGHHPAHSLGTDARGGSLLSHDVFSGNKPSEQIYEGAAIQTRTLYAGANRLTRHSSGAADIPIASSMRAPREAVGMLALECAMDELAEKLELDPSSCACATSRPRIRRCIFRIPADTWSPASRRARDASDGQAESDAESGSRTDAGLFGIGDGRGHTRKFASAFESQCAAGIGRFRHSAHGDDGYRHRQPIRSSPDRRRNARPADGSNSHGMGDTSFPQAAARAAPGCGQLRLSPLDACNTLRGKLARIAGMDPGTARFATDASKLRPVQGTDRSRRRRTRGRWRDRPAKTLKDFSQQSYGAHFAGSRR